MSFFFSDLALFVALRERTNTTSHLLRPALGACVCVPSPLSYFVFTPSSLVKNKQQMPRDDDSFF